MKQLDLFRGQFSALCTKGWTERCARARGLKCDCSCGGANHKKTLFTNLTVIMPKLCSYPDCGIDCMVESKGKGEIYRIKYIPSLPNTGLGEARLCQKHAMEYTRSNNLKTKAFLIKLDEERTKNLQK